MISMHIVTTVKDHAPPEWPRPFGGSWAAFADARQNVDELQRSIAVDYLNRITLAESLAASSVATLLIAWRDAIDFGDESMQRAALGIRNWLASGWRIRLASPPPQHELRAFAARVTRRYDLMPRQAREQVWGPL